MHHSTRDAHLSWTSRLENVLDDRAALDVFRSWLAANSFKEPLDLYYAIRAFEKMARERDVKAIELARSIHEKYTSTRTGCMPYISNKIRSEIGLRIKNIGQVADGRLFEPLAQTIDSLLREQHAQFITSDEFLNAFNRCHQSPMKSCAPLTAETLKRSRHNRQNEDSKFERMYSNSNNNNNNNKWRPYVCKATTSQNDSAVSSNFSSEAHSSRRLRNIREEHVRENPSTFVLPRVENTSMNCGEQFDHATEEGRNRFANVLMKKLHKEQSRMRRNDETQRQLRDIEDRKCTMREFISTAETVYPIDEEADLDRYVERMSEDSLKASAQRSPRLNNASPPHNHDERNFMTMTSSYSRSYPHPAATSVSSNNSFNTSSFYKDRYQNTSRYESSGIGSLAPSEYSNRSRRSATMDRSTTKKNSSSNTNHPLITISCKDSTGVPSVAHVPFIDNKMTLREFRKHLSISSSAHVQFFFKTECEEDDESPHQLLLIKEDSAQLPVFLGKISAELRPISPE